MKYGVMEGFRMHHSQRAYGLESMGDRSWLLRKAKELGFHGVELGFGLDYRDDPLWTGDAHAWQSIKEESTSTGIEVVSICLHLLNYEENSPSSSNPMHRETAYHIISNTIEACSRIGAHVILTPFFGTALLKTDKQLQTLTGEMKKLSSLADENDVCLALETSLNAQDMIRLVEAINSDHVQVYYDIGNMTGYGVDVVNEIKTLSEHIAQVHVKDNPSGTLGDGNIDIAGVTEALRGVGFDGYLVLETPSLDNSVEAATYNLNYLRRVVEGPLEES